MRSQPPVSSLTERILDLVQAVDRGHDFTNVNRAEKYFSDCLRDVIVHGGDTAHREVAYLDSQKHCDLFADIGGQRCYLEVKLLFPTYWASRWPARGRQRLLDPLESFTLPPEFHSAARDLAKLATHRLDRPDQLGILIVSSHDAHYDTDHDFATLASLTRLDQPPWVQAVRRFPNTHWHAKGGYQLDARIWLCPADRLAGWWETVKHLYGT